MLVYSIIAKLLFGFNGGLTHCLAHKVHYGKGPLQFLSWKEIHPISRGSQFVWYWGTMVVNPEALSGTKSSGEISSNCIRRAPYMLDIFLQEKNWVILLHYYFCYWRNHVSKSTFIKSCTSSKCQRTEIFMKLDECQLHVFSWVMSVKEYWRSIP
jgi:hypothetical protein